MEAASARAAARDRFTEFGRAPSQLQRYIQGACSPENYEPNLALNLEVSDLVNSKKGIAPREAATAICNYINHRNPNIALLALSLLDICVKNCGYPFHLQISTKEFLNELVRRFPERPPIRPTRVQTRILSLLEEWRTTICETSRYKDDLGFIRDMHRLLSYKGYAFPEVRSEAAAVLNPSENLKSPEEMEEEEKEAHSAKLQELIRRGSPEDLREANRLMKIMAGYDTRSKTDYRAKAAEEVGKIQAKARLLEERLEAFKAGDKMVEGDVFSELASSLSSAQPKIQKMCEEESDDHEAVARLLEINDSIHRTVERYKLMKRGDLEAAAKVAAGGPTPTQAIGKAAANELSLIDFDAEASNGASNQASSNAVPNAGSSSAGGLENDLLGLDLGGGSTNSFGQGGSISLGFGANQNIPGPALLSSLTANSSARGPSTSQPGSLSHFDILSTPTGSSSTTPQPPTFQQSSYQPPPQPPANDPFAALGSAANIGLTSSPKPPSQSAVPPPPSSKPATSNDDDEWSFASALPATGPAKQSVYSDTINNTQVRITIHASRQQYSPAIHLEFAFTNATSFAMDELHFQLAVTKGFELALTPQTGRYLAPNGGSQVKQTGDVFHAGNRSLKVENAKLRWKVSFRLNGEEKNATGAVPEFWIA